MIRTRTVIGQRLQAVSYTHLDVYKRQGLASSAEDAVAQVQRARPAVVLGAAQVDLLRHWQLVYQAQTVIITTAE